MEVVERRGLNPRYVGTSGDMYDARGPTRPGKVRGW